MHNLLTQDQTIVLLRQLAGLSGWLNEELPGKVRLAKAEGAILMGMVAIVVTLFMEGLALPIMVVLTSVIVAFTLLPIWQTVMSLWTQIRQPSEAAPVAQSTQEAADVPHLTAQPTV